MIGCGPASMYGASINQEGGNMFGNNEENESKNKIEELEEKVEALENKIANIMDVLQMQDEFDVGEEDDIRDEGRVRSSSRRTSYYNGGNKVSKEEEKDILLKCLKFR